MYKERSVDRRRNTERTVWYPTAICEFELVSCHREPKMAKIARPRGIVEETQDQRQYSSLEAALQECEGSINSSAKTGPQPVDE
jgi:hypothetical protein